MSAVVRGTRVFDTDVEPTESELDGLPLVEVWRLAQEVQRSRTSRRSARTRRMNRMDTTPLPESSGADDSRVLVDGETGEVLAQGITYREGDNVVRLPVGMRPEDVPPPACVNDYVQVCRTQHRAIQEYLRGQGFGESVRSLWTELVIEADQFGRVEMTAAEVARRHEVDPSTALRWLRALESRDLVALNLSRGRGGGLVTVLNYTQVARLDLVARVRLGERRLKRERIVEEEIVIRRRVTTKEYES